MNYNILQRFLKGLLEDEPNEWYSMIQDSSIYEVIPELKDQLIDHNSTYHQEIFRDLGNTILAHTMLVVSHAFIRSQEAPRMDQIICRLSALLHDIGKPYCRFTKEDGKCSYVKHDIIGADLARDIMKRLGYSEEIQSIIYECVRNHMRLHDLPKIKKQHSGRRLLGNHYIDYIIELCICDTKGTINSSSPEPDCSNLLKAIEEWRYKYPEMLPPQIINEWDIILGDGVRRPYPAKKTIRPEDIQECLRKTYNYQLDGCEDRNVLISYC